MNPDCRVLWESCPSSSLSVFFLPFQYTATTPSHLSVSVFLAAGKSFSNAEMKRTVLICQSAGGQDAQCLQHSMLYTWEKQLLGGGLAFKGKGLECPLDQCKHHEVQLWGTAWLTEGEVVEAISSLEWREGVNVLACPGEEGQHSRGLLSLHSEAMPLAVCV